MNKLFDYLAHTKIQLPAYEVAVFLIIIIITMLTRTRRTGQMIAFIFGYRLGWIFINGAADLAKFSVPYKIFGAMGAIIIIYMYSKEG